MFAPIDYCLFNIQTLFVNIDFQIMELCDVLICNCVRFDCSPITKDEYVKRVNWGLTIGLLSLLNVNPCVKEVNGAQICKSYAGY